jgi:hypothetical protein
VTSASAWHWNLLHTWAYLYIVQVPSPATVGYTEDKARDRHYANDPSGELRSAVDTHTQHLINQGSPVSCVSHATLFMCALFWVKFLTTEPCVTALKMCMYFVCSYLYFCVSEMSEVRQKCVHCWNKCFSHTVVKIVDGKYMVSSVEQAQGRRCLGDLGVDWRIMLNRSSRHGTRRSSGRRVLWFRRVLWLLWTLWWTFEVHKSIQYVAVWSVISFSITLWIM